MAVTPAGPPPGHSHLDSLKRFARSGHLWERRQVRGDVPIPERARVDVRDEDRASAERPDEGTPQNGGGDDQEDERETSPHARRLYLGRGSEAAVADAVFDLLPERDDLARVEDRRVRPRDDADEQREREVAHREPAEEEEREQGEDDGQRGDHGPRERLHDRVVDHRVERLAWIQAEVLADPVEYHDRVVDREADDRQDCRDEEAVDLDLQEEPEDREDAQDDRGVVQQRDDGADAIAERGPAEVPEP